MADKQQASQTDSKPIRGFIVPLDGAGMLVPNGTVAEIVDYLHPVEIPGSPDWMAGMFNWRGLRIPLFSIEHAMGKPADETTKRTRVLVINALGATQNIKVFGVISRGIPNLVMIDRGDIESQEQILKSPVVRAYAKVHGNDVFIPDLDRIEMMLAGIEAQQANTEGSSD